MRQFGIPTTERLGIASVPDRANLCDAIDTAIEALRESGEFKEQRAAWSGTGVAL
ncbi:MAG TPA: hypothetical protein VEK34_05215 [Methylocella sp.]|nr:hypothetical protein [Methylocella sp.]